MAVAVGPQPVPARVEQRVEVVQRVARQARRADRLQVAQGPHDARGAEVQRGRCDVRVAVLDVARVHRPPRSHREMLLGVAHDPLDHLAGAAGVPLRRLQRLVAGAVEEHRGSGTLRRRAVVLYGWQRRPWPLTS